MHTKHLSIQKQKKLHNSTIFSIEKQNNINYNETMKKKIDEFVKISDENILMIVLAFLSFSTGIWTNYRQLWLENVGFNVQDISKILSAALICSSIISFIISIYSTRVKVKNVVLLTTIFKSFSMLTLLLNKNTYVIKVCMLICIMCETIFSIAFYPLLSTVNKKESAIKKQALVNYLAKDAGIITCGLLIGVTVGNIVFDYNSCLFISMISSILGCLTLILFDQNKYYNKRNILPLKKALKNLAKSKVNNYFLFTQFIMNISYGMIFGIAMLVLTNYIGFNVSVASVFIIVCNLIGSIACSLFNNHADYLSVRMSTLIKYGSRVLVYSLAFLVPNMFTFIFAYVVAHISARILDDKVNGTYVRRIKTNSQFLFGNIRYFILSLGEGVGTYLAGYMLKISFRSLFLGASIFTVLQIIMFLNLDKIRES